MKALFVGDMHFRQTWHHGQDFEDGRRDERLQIEDAIVAAAEPCDVVILGGDVLDARDNPSSVIKSLVHFLEKFGDKKIYLMGGNHDSDTSGKCALDFIRELSNKNWEVVHDDIIGHADHGKRIAMIPYFRRQQLGVETDEGVVHAIMQRLDSPMGPPDVVILHHAIAGTKTATGMMTDTFQEPAFAAEDLLKRAKRVLGCHIHLPADHGRLQIVGSVMNQDVGETEDKRVLRWDSTTDEMESIVLPGRKLMKLVNPTAKQLAGIKDYNGLVKIVSDGPIEVPPGLAEKVIVVEMPKSDRKKVTMTDDFSPQNLLKIYAEARDVPLDKLLKGWALINE